MQEHVEEYQFKDAYKTYQEFFAKEKETVGTVKPNHTKFHHFFQRLLPHEYSSLCLHLELLLSYLFFSSSSKLPERKSRRNRKRSKESRRSSKQRKNNKWRGTNSVNSMQNQWQLSNLYPKDGMNSMRMNYHNLWKEWIQLTKPPLSCILIRFGEVTMTRYCALCKKHFKTNSQWENHERSKRHIQAAKELNKFLKEESKTTNTSDKQKITKKEKKQQQTLGDDAQDVIEKIN